MEKILKQALSKITPTDEEKRKEMAFADSIVKKIMKMKGKHTKAQIVGSIARSTQLRADNDIDIFVFFPLNLSREEFEKEGIKIGKAIFRGKKYEKAYSEHPYIRGKISGFELEIVPAYDVEHSEQKQSAVDRSALHNKYLISKIQKGQEHEIRLLKQFMKGVKCYGADLSSNSFPGYVAELLVLKYGKFIDAIKECAKWGKREVIDVEEQLNKEDAMKKFNSHLVVIDPSDPNRNVAAALSENQYARFISACRAFLKKPSINFFFPKPHRQWSAKKLKEFLQKTELIALQIGYPKSIVEDVMWGQIRRFARKISTAIAQQGFTIERYSEWIEYKKQLIILIEVESTQLPKAKMLIGPQSTDEKNSEKFLKAHGKKLSGPRIEKGRWVIEVERKYDKIEKYLGDFLVKMKKEEKEGIKKALREKAKIMDEKEITALYKKNKEFGQFLTTYLKGKEEFLDY